MLGARAVKALLPDERVIGLGAGGVMGDVALPESERDEMEV